MKRIFITLGILWLFVAQLCARSVRVWGYVVDSDNRGIELANVVVIEDEGAGGGGGIYKDSDDAFKTLKHIDTIQPEADSEPYKQAYKLWVERLEK